MEHEIDEIYELPEPLDEECWECDDNEAIPRAYSPWRLS